MFLDVHSLSEALRKKVINLEKQEVLISKISSSKQENDLTLPPNCNGFGRIRHFRIYRNSNWTLDTLPNIPYATCMNLPIEEVLQTQLFQIGACDFRCWFCFVDESRLSANIKVSRFFTVDEIFDLYFKEEIQPKVIDLSGGQPNLAPEWLYWTLQKIEKLDRNDLYIWSDDNLSNYFYWKYLSPYQRDFISSFYNQGRVGCFKGFDDESFSFNTNAKAQYFNNQFDIFSKLLGEKLDLYAYIVLTSISTNELGKRMKVFVDRLQNIHHNLPLRTIPLEIVLYAPSRNRISNLNNYEAIENQHIVHACWLEELDKRFNADERQTQISQIKMNGYEK